MLHVRMCLCASLSLALLVCASVWFSVRVSVCFHGLLLHAIHFPANNCISVVTCCFLFLRSMLAGSPGVLTAIVQSASVCACVSIAHMCLHVSVFPSAFVCATLCVRVPVCVRICACVCGHFCAHIFMRMRVCVPLPAGPFITLGELMQFDWCRPLWT